MEICYDTKVGFKFFKFLIVGSTFIFEDKLYMKTTKYEDKENNVFINAVNLETGDLCFVDIDMAVIRVKAKVDVSLGD